MKLHGEGLKDYALRIFRFDGRSLATFRILLALMVLLDLGARMMVFEEMYTESGFVPIEVVKDVYDREILSWSHFSLHLLHGSTKLQFGLFGMAVFSAVCLGIGWHTRLFSVASWILYVSVFTRTPVYVSGADVTLGFMLFWAMFLPLGDRFSIDVKRSHKHMDVVDPVSLAGGFGYVSQVWVVYTFAAYFKIHTWPSGGALAEIMNIDLLVTELGRSLTEFPRLLNVLTRLTFFVEAFGVLLLLIPWRRDLMRGICVMLFMGLHLGIALTCDIGLFPYISIILWVPLIPAAFWNNVSRLISRTLFSRRFERTGTPDGHVPATSTAVTIAKIQSPIAVFGITLACTTVAAVLFWNLGGPARRMFPQMGGIVSHYMSFTKLIQHWALFANENKLTRDGWFIVQGQLPDGTDVDILRNISPVDWGRPPLSGPRRIPVLWRTYLAGQERGDGENLEQFARYLNNRWKRSHASQGFQSIRIIFMLESGDGPAGQTNATPIVFWSGSMATETSDGE